MNATKQIIFYPPKTPSPKIYTSKLTPLIIHAHSFSPHTKHNLNIEEYMIILVFEQNGFAELICSSSAI